MTRNLKDQYVRCPNENVILPNSKTGKFYFFKKVYDQKTNKQIKIINGIRSNTMFQIRMILFWNFYIHYNNGIYIFILLNLFNLLNGLKYVNHDFLGHDGLEK